MDWIVYIKNDFFIKHIITDMKRLYFTFIYTFSFITFFSDAEVTDIAGTCTDESIKYTNKVVDISKKSACYKPEPDETSQTEAAAVCNECSQGDVSTTSESVSSDITWVAEQEQRFLQSCETRKHKRRMERRNQQLDIPEVCFHAGMLRTSDAVPRFYHCEDKSKVNPTKANSDYRPCFTPNYVKMTANAFNDMADCFDFPKKERKEAFATFNHESAFNLNARSKSGARCYGQMTFPRFQDLNKYIYFSKEKSRDSWRAYHEIYNEALEKCPELKNAVIPTELLDDERVGNAQLDQHNKNPPFTCAITMDPYTCFFYSMYNLKVLQAKFDFFYENGPSYLGNRELSPKVTRDFQLRIERNEMLTVKGTVITRTGEKREVNWTFWSDAEIYDTLVKNGFSYDINDLEIKKVPLFNPEELKTYLVHTAHNGGDSIVSDHLVGFLKQLKRQISNGVQCNRSSACKKYRERIFNFETNAENPSALSLEDLEKEFKRYASRTRGEDRIRGETRKFMDGRSKHLRVLLSDLYGYKPLDSRGIHPSCCSNEARVRPEYESLYTLECNNP